MHPVHALGIGLLHGLSIRFRFGSIRMAGKPFIQNVYLSLLRYHNFLRKFSHGCVSTILQLDFCHVDGAAMMPQHAFRKGGIGIVICHTDHHLIMHSCHRLSVVFENVCHLLFICHCIATCHIMTIHILLISRHLSCWCRDFFCGHHLTTLCCWLTGAQNKSSRNAGGEQGKTTRSNHDISL